jgi:hypothetical protein
MHLRSRRREHRRQFSIAIFSLCLIAVWAMTAVVAMGQITITPPKPGLHEPIIANLSLGPDIPEGAKIRGSWDCGAAKWLEPSCVGPVAVKQVYIWAAAGTYTIRATGIWVLTKDVTVGEQTFPVLMDFGQYDYRASLVVSGGGPGPDPPDPPNPGGKYRIVMFYSADQLDNYPQPQRSLLTSRQYREQLVSLGHIFLEVLEEASLASASGAFAPFIESVKGDPLPRIAIVPVAGGKVLDFPLPADMPALLKLLEKPQ